MKEYDSCEMERRYTLGTRLCPYCKKYEYTIDVIVKINEEKGIVTQAVRVIGDDWHLKYCRAERKLKAHNYRVQGINSCANCKYFMAEEWHYDGDRDPDQCINPEIKTKGYVILEVEPLGLCDLWEKE